MGAEVVINPMFRPAMREIIAITNSYPAIVTTGLMSFPGNVPTPTPMVHDYNSGLVVQLWIPEGFGMPQAHLLFAPITVTSPTDFSIDIDTRDFCPFAIPPVVYSISPTSGLPVARWPYRTLQDGSVAGLLTLLQFAQALPKSDTGYPAQNAMRNVLPTP